MYSYYRPELKGLHREASRAAHARQEYLAEAARAANLVHRLELERRDLMRQVAREIGMD